MNKFFVIALLLGTGLIMTSVDAAAQQKLVTLSDSIGYLTGRQFGQTVVAQGMPINRAIVIAGVRDALSNGTPRLTDDQIDQVNYGVTVRAQKLVATGDTLENVMQKLYGTTTTNGPDNMRTFNDSVSYALGFRYGQGAAGQNQGFNTALLLAGLEDYLLDRTSRLSEAAELSLMARQVEEMKRQMKADADRYAAELAFMDSIRTNPAFYRLNNGIIYEVVTEGKGAKPGIDDVVSLVIRSYFIGEKKPYHDGADAPAMVITVGEAMPAFVDVLQMMKMGSTWRLYLPEDVAFANAPPNVKKRPLMFEIDLISIEKKK